MKKTILTAFLVAIFHLPQSFAAEVKLSHGEGTPGDLVKLILSLDPVPIDGFGLFSLDLDLHFNPNLVQYVSNSAKEIDLFIGDEDDPTHKVADFSELNVEMFSNRVRLNLGASYTGGTAIFPQAPGSGSIVELAFRIMNNAQVGAAPITVEVISSVENSVDFATSGAVEITAIPLPPAVLLLGAPLSWLFLRRRA